MELNSLSLQSKIYKMDDKQVGKRIILIEMKDEPFPIESGTMGTIRHIGGDVINVDWDNGRYLGVVIGTDKFRIIED